MSLCGKKQKNTFSTENHAAQFQKTAAHLFVSCGEKPFFTFAAFIKKKTPLSTELRLLSEAGFPEPDCFWRDEHSVVFGGIK